MSLIQRLKNGETRLLGLTYGNDRFDNGNSGQPYIKNPIPRNFGPFSDDFLLRGGATAVVNSGKDVLRLGKMFADFRSPKGLFFIIKQNLLSRTAVRTQTSGILNEDVYNPLNTLAQAGIVAFGGHLNKQGILPTGPLAIKTYSQTVKSTQDDNKNRLTLLYKLSKEKSPQNEQINDITLSNTVNVMSYPSGPGSFLGSGNTNIRFADQRTGINNKLFNNPYFNGRDKRNSNISGSILNYTPVFLHIRKDLDDKIYFGNEGEGGLNRFKEARGVSQTYSELVGGKTSESIYPDNLLNHQISVYTQGNTFPNNSDRIYDNNTFTYNQNQITGSNVNINGGNGSPTIQDFRAILRSDNSLPKNKKDIAVKIGSLTEAPSYTGNKAYESRINIGGPDRKGPGSRANNDYSDYSKGVIYSSEKSGPLDQINALTELGKKSANDLVKFRITFINNTTPSNLKYLHFRAFLDSMSDSYNATWNNFNYLGRNESFYTYGGYTRTISLGWTVAAQSKQELIPMYKKLNFLASSLTGDYSGDGYMRGNLVKLTVGGYLYEQPGIITSLTYDVPEESPWEIGINTKGKNDPTVKELPHIIRVTGFNFTPIQTFIPQIQDGINGSRHYISLSNGLDNYNEQSDFLIKEFLNFNKTNVTDPKDEKEYQEAIERKKLMAVNANEIISPSVEEAFGLNPISL
jgi:hypothetical protein